MKVDVCVCVCAQACTPFAHIMEISCEENRNKPCPFSEPQLLIYKKELKTESQILATET